jgi:uncharacterized protein (TIGR02646 family)
MIFVNRHKVPVPGVLTDPEKPGRKETGKAIAHYTGAHTATPFAFKAYADPEVKAALIKLFNQKCAYCESVFLHVYPGDVEHFRPKGEITEAPNPQPGYYWLAADWDNLLLSCRNCNQKLAHALFGENHKKVMGKMNQFPLLDETKRVRQHDHPQGVEAEEPYRLLLNPCIDNPEEHLEYDENSGVIKARKVHGTASIKALKSIEVYALQRVPLVLAREKLLIDIHAQLQRVKEAVVRYNEALDGSGAGEKFLFERRLKQELEWLNRFIQPDKEYAGMARQVIGRFLQANFGITI